jgi:regulator of protease activity HflC (stomatin/prohibitin superfamily)
MSATETVLKGVKLLEEAPEPEDIEIIGDVPYERIQSVDESLVADFHTVTDFKNKYKHGNFNDLGKKIPRDETRETNTTSKVIKAVNQYSYGPSRPPMIAGAVLNVVSLSLRYWWKRRYIREGYYGHYRSSGRDMFVPPGHRSLVSTVENWVIQEGTPEVPIDDETHLTRTFGSKILIYVPENHIGGAYRVGIELAEDGEFVIFPQGHHVLPDENYREVKIVELVPNRPIELGPLTILFIKEGYIGGAYSKTDGRYAIFSPGPPYIFNKKDYYDSVIVKRTTDRFIVGPVTFLTIPKGYLGSATHKTGKTQYLYPGKTYQLHEKDFSNIEVKPRTPIFSLGSCYFLTVESGHLACARNKKSGEYELFESGHTYQLSKEIYEEPKMTRHTLNFELGPYYFVTVEEGYLVGALNKKKGEFELFNSGSTFKLHSSDYEKPIIQRVDSYVVTCGHYTKITPRDDMLIGAFRYAKTGEVSEFVEFDSPTIIHSYRDFYGLEAIKKYSNEPQKFGPFNIVTVPSGFAGVFNCQGKLEIKEAGWYKLPAEYEFKNFIPLKTFPTKLEVSFTTKDGVTMNVTLTIVWSVKDAKDVSLYPGGLDEIKNEIMIQSKLVVSKLCRNYNRDQILPTKQDVLMKVGSDVDEETINEFLKKNDKETEELYRHLQDNFSKTLDYSLKSSKTGTIIESARLENFILMDEGIIENLHKITQAIVDTNRQKVEAEKDLKEIQNKAKLAEEQEKAKATVAIEKAKAEARVIEEQQSAKAKVEIERAKADAEIKKQQVLAEVSVDKEKAEAQAVVDRKKALAQAEIERDRAKMLLEKAKAEAESKTVNAKADADSIRLKAEAEANSIQMKLQAEAEGKRKAIEAESLMSNQQLQIELAKLEVEMAKGYGEAAWKNPDKIERLLENFKGRITMGNIDLQELVLRERMDEHDRPKEERRPIDAASLRASGLGRTSPTLKQAALNSLQS